MFPQMASLREMKTRQERARLRPSELLPTQATLPPSK